MANNQNTLSTCTGQLVMTEPDVESMLVFAQVVQQESFTRAARKIGLSKQAVSERVGRLEEALGVKLLHRTTRSLHPTDAGAGYARACLSILAQVEEANAEVMSHQVEPSGLLRVSVPVVYGRRFLGPVVAQFLARYPRVRLEVVLTNRRTHLVDDGVDLAIRVGELDDSNLVAKLLGWGEVSIVGSPDYLCRLRREGNENLSEARVISLRGQETWTLGSTSVRVDPVLVVDDLELVQKAAIAGVGLARLPSFISSDAMSQGTLEHAFPDIAPERRPVYAVWPAREYLPPKVRLFVDAIAENIQLLPDKPAH